MTRKHSQIQNIVEILKKRENGHLSWWATDHSWILHRAASRLQIGSFQHIFRRAANVFPNVRAFCEWFTMHCTSCKISVFSLAQTNPLNKSRFRGNFLEKTTGFLRVVFSPLYELHHQFYFHSQKSKHRWESHENCKFGWPVCLCFSNAYFLRSLVLTGETVPPP